MDDLDLDLVPYLDWPLRYGQCGVNCGSEDCRAGGCDVSGSMPLTDSETEAGTARQLLAAIREHLQG